MIWPVKKRTIKAGAIVCEQVAEISPKIPTLVVDEAVKPRSGVSVTPSQTIGHTADAGALSDLFPLPTDL